MGKEMDCQEMMTHDPQATSFAYGSTPSQGQECIPVSSFGLMINFDCFSLLVIIVTLQQRRTLYYYTIEY